MLKRIIEVLFMSAFTALLFVTNNDNCIESQTVNKAYYIEKTQIPNAICLTVDYGVLYSPSYDEIQEEIRNEIMYGEVELIAQIIRAEAGNQDELGKRYVADVILNRVNDKSFPDTVEAVVFQKDPPQFACVIDDNFEKAGWTVTEEDYRIALEEYVGYRQNTDIVYFRTDKYGDGTPAFKHGDHYFSTK